MKVELALILDDVLLLICLKGTAVIITIIIIATNVVEKRMLFNKTIQYTNV